MKTMRKIVQIFITAFSILKISPSAAELRRDMVSKLSKDTKTYARIFKINDNYVIFEMIKAKTFSDVFNITLYDFNKKKTTKLQDFETYNYI